MLKSRSVQHALDMLFVIFIIHGINNICKISMNVYLRLNVEWMSNK